MLSKTVRFELWRGETGGRDQRCLDTVFLIEEYLNSVPDLERIKTDLSNPQSEHFIHLNQYGLRILGLLVYCKLSVEESIDLLPDATTREGQLLTEIKDILGAIFDKPQTNAKNNVTTLMANTAALLAMDLSELPNKKQAKILCFAAYAMLNVLTVIISKLGGMTKALVTALVNLDEMNAKIVMLMRATEEKMIQINHYLSNQPPETQTDKKTIQAYLNERFAQHFKKRDHPIEQLKKLENEVSTIRVDISRLVSFRLEKDSLTAKIQKIQNLLNKITENDSKLLKRKYALELIHSEQDSFELLMSTISGIRKERLEALIRKLKNPNRVQRISSAVLYGLSWATSLVTIVYRWGIPQAIQNSMVEKLPITRDSRCKLELKNAAKDCIASLKTQLVEINKEIKKVTSKLSEKNEALNTLINLESTDNLQQLLRANYAAKETLAQYRKLLFHFQEQSRRFLPFKDTCRILDQFIETHDNWLVKISDFLATIWPIFKLDTALLIDKARLVKNRLKAYESACKRQVTEVVAAMEHNQALPDVLKSKLKSEFDSAWVVNRRQRQFPKCNPNEIKTIILQTTLFFNAAEKERITTHLEAKPQMSRTAGLVAG